MRFAFLTSSQVLMPALPAWPAEARALASFPDFCAVLRRHSPAVEIERQQDAAYVKVPHATLAAAITLTLERLRADGVRYTVNAFDCEDFRNELCQTLRKIAARAGIPLAGIVGGLDVFNAVSWADVPAGGFHAVACVDVLESGPVVIEAQNGHMTPLELYPNRARIDRARGF